MQPANFPQDLERGDAQGRDGNGAVRRDLGGRTVAVSVQTLGVDIAGNGEQKRKRTAQRQSRAPARS